MMCRLPVKRLSKVQILLWNYDSANSAIFGHKQMLGHSVLQTPALVLFIFLPTFQLHQGLPISRKGHSISG